MLTKLRRSSLSLSFPPPPTHPLDWKNFYICCWLLDAVNLFAVGGDIAINEEYVIREYVLMLEMAGSSEAKHMGLQESGVGLWNRHCARRWRSGPKNAWGIGLFWPRQTESSKQVLLKGLLPHLVLVFSTAFLVGFDKVIVGTFSVRMSRPHSP